MTQQIYGQSCLDLIDGLRRSAEHPAIANPRINCHHRHLPPHATLAKRCTQHCCLTLMQVLIATERQHTPTSTIAIAYWQSLVQTSTVLFAKQPVFRTVGGKVKMPACFSYKGSTLALNEALKLCTV